MTNFKKFIINGALITATSLVLRFTGLTFNSYLSAKLGSEGMGIYTLINSVYTFAVVFASSGISLATTRLVSEAKAVGDGYNAKRSVYTAIFYSICVSLFASSALFCSAETVGIKLLRDQRTVMPLKVLSATLPLVSLSGVFNGYFTAVRKAYKSAMTVFFENFANIFIIVRLITYFSSGSLEGACLAIAAGTVLSEALSLCFSIIIYAADAKKTKTEKGEKSGLMKKFSAITLPLSLSAYARQGLVTVEHLLIPFGLEKNGMPRSEAVSVYGVVHGMAFPVVMFPSCLIYSFASLLVPEFAEYRKKNEKEKIDFGASAVLKYAVLFAVGTAGIMHCFSYEISLAFYSSSEPYKYISLFSPLICVMYLDATVDGMLKGLNEQLYSMKVNLTDAALSVICVLLLVPKFGISGYIAAVFICEIFNFTLSFYRLVNVCSIKLDLVRDLLTPVLSVLISTKLVSLVSSRINAFGLSGGFYLCLRISASAALYLLPLFLLRKREATAVKAI